MCVCVCMLHITLQSYKEYIIRKSVLKSSRKQFCGFNYAHVHEMKQKVTIMAESLEPARCCSSHYLNCSSFHAVFRQ